MLCKIRKEGSYEQLNVFEVPTCQRDSLALTPVISVTYRRTRPCCPPKVKTYLFYSISLALLLATRSHVPWTCDITGVRAGACLTIITS